MLLAMQQLLSVQGALDLRSINRSRSVGEIAKLWSLGSLISISAGQSVRSFLECQGNYGHHLSAKRVNPNNNLIKAIVFRGSLEGSGRTLRSKWISQALYWGSKVLDYGRHCRHHLFFNSAAWACLGLQAHGRGRVLARLWCRRGDPYHIRSARPSSACARRGGWHHRRQSHERQKSLDLNLQGLLQCW